MTMDLRRPLLIFALYVVLLQLADVIADDEFAISFLLRACLSCSCAICYYQPSSLAKMEPMSCVPSGDDSF
ncbi:hypothetical protein OUZ56_027754 [Daphnia magna]|uniref:Secreted protein n=1 Tax=Daphnia magna TaxID=35525 RepID=A0ABR0B1U2_9CRUS|nr:hypothetical protein OUZ56_027754 [Daphnia magna]